MRKIISFSVLVTFLFINTAYSVASTITLRVPLGASKRAGETTETLKKDENPLPLSNEGLTDDAKSGLKDFPAKTNTSKLISSLRRAKDDEEVERISKALLNRKSEEVNRHLQDLIDILNDARMKDYIRKKAGEIICKVTEPTRAATILVETVAQESDNGSVVWGLLSNINYYIDVSGIKKADRVALAESLIGKSSEIISKLEGLEGFSHEKIIWENANLAIYGFIATVAPSTIETAIRNLRDADYLTVTGLLGEMFNLNDSGMIGDRAQEGTERNARLILKYLAQTDDVNDIDNILNIASLLEEVLPPSDTVEVLISKFKETEDEILRSNIEYTLGRFFGYNRVLKWWIKGLSIKSFPVAAAKRGISKSNVEELLNSRLSQFEGILISSNMQIVVDSNVSTIVNKLATLLDSSISKIDLLASYDLPDNGIEIHVVEYLPTNVRKVIDPSGRVHFLFDRYFVETLIGNQDEHPVAVPWVLGERLAHELSHSNKIGTQEQEKEEEMDIIISVDLQLYRRLLANKPLKDEVDRFFAEVKPIFESGHYFNDLLGDIAYKPSLEARKQVEAYLDIYYDFDAAADWWVRNSDTHASTQEVILVRENGSTEHFLTKDFPLGIKKWLSSLILGSAIDKDLRKRLKLKFGKDASHIFEKIDSITSKNNIAICKDTSFGADSLRVSETNEQSQKGLNDIITKLMEIEVSYQEMLEYLTSLEGVSDALVEAQLASSNFNRQFMVAQTFKLKILRIGGIIESAQHATQAADIVKRFIQKPGYGYDYFLHGAGGFNYVKSFQRFKEYVLSFEMLVDALIEEKSIDYNKPASGIVLAVESSNSDQELFENFALGVRLVKKGIDFYYTFAALDTLSMSVGTEERRPQIINISNESDSLLELLHGLSEVYAEADAEDKMYGQARNQQERLMSKLSELEAAHGTKGGTKSFPIGFHANLLKRVRGQI